MYIMNTRGLYSNIPFHTVLCISTLQWHNETKQKKTPEEQQRKQCLWTAAPLMLTFGFTYSVTNGKRKEHKG